MRHTTAKRCRKHDPVFQYQAAFARKDGVEVTLGVFRCSICGRRMYQNNRGHWQQRPGS